MDDATDTEGSDAPGELAPFLSRYPPFDTLDDAAVHRVADAAHTVTVGDGREIVDAFVEPTRALYVVLAGQVDLWNSVDLTDERADERLGPGGIFGFTALLTQRATGPRAVAVGRTTLAAIPADTARPALTSASGARFLAEQGVRSPGAPSAYGTVDELIVNPPVLVTPGTPVDDVARRMTAGGVAYAAVDFGEGRFGLITDALLRRRIIVDGRPSDTPAGELVEPATPQTRLGDSSAEALIALQDNGEEFLLVVDDAGRLRGAVTPSDFAVAPTTATVALRQQVVQAPDEDALVERAQRAPSMVVDLLARGLATSKVLSVYSATVDAVVRRALVLVFARHPDLDVDAFTWLALGSNGRREAVLSSDVDSAVSFDDAVGETEQARYREAFADVDRLLVRAGLTVDAHGATAARAAFSRTNADWRRAAQDWLADPVANQGAMMTSLLVDGRPIHGDPGLPAVTRVFGDLRRHPGTMRLLLQESLARRARLRSVRDVLARRGGTFDLKTHALTPVINVARWAALSVGFPGLSTIERLRAAGGSQMLPADSATTLADVFEALQRTRVRSQLAQRRRGTPPQDVVTMHSLPPIDRSVIAQAVREISSVQKRMDNVAQYVPPEQWSGRA